MERLRNGTSVAPKNAAGVRRRFPHVNDALTRTVLEAAKPASLDQLDLSLAIQRTGLHINFELASGTVDRGIVGERAIAYVEAEVAAGKGNRAAALEALRKAWAHNFGTALGLAPRSGTGDKRASS